MAVGLVAVLGGAGAAGADFSASSNAPASDSARVQKAIKSGTVTSVGEVLTRPSTPVDAGMEITIGLDDGREVSTDVAGRRIKDLVVLYEDAEIVAIHKPAGLVTHPNARQIAGTVSDLAVRQFGPLPEVQGENRPGIVHRLDRLTSGVLVLGKTEAALEHLKAQFKARTVAKTYFAIVHGTPRFDSEWLTRPMEPSPKYPDRMRVVPLGKEEEHLEEGGARTAETLMERLEDLGPATLVAAKPKTGRTHQIRVHLQAAGFPIVGDRVYGTKGAVKSPMPRKAHAMERPALHARRLEVDHPRSGERMTFEADLPEDMERLLATLRAELGKDE